VLVMLELPVTQSAERLAKTVSPVKSLTKSAVTLAAVAPAL
jgi:hypothetical protein